MTVSIIIPALDEWTALPRCLAAIRAQEPPLEVLVVDGGSRDATVDVARAAGARVLSAPRGRGRQLAAGAAASRGEVLLFLHADSVLPPDGVARIRQAVRSGADYGAFCQRFERDGADVRIGAWLADAYCRVTRDLFGDRGMWATRVAYRQVGGFRDLELMEDLDLAVRFRAAGLRMVLLPGVVRTSTRRIDRVGMLRFAWRCFRMIRAFHRGRPGPERYRRFFRGAASDGRDA